MMDGEDPMMVTGKDEEGNTILEKPNIVISSFCSVL